MALFDRDDDRGYGYRGDPDRRHGGGFVDRAQNAVRRGWDRVENAFEGQDVHRGREFGPGDEHLRRDYENRSTMDTGYGRGWNAGRYNRPMDREGGLHQRNSWSDGAWTADAGERADREWNLGNRGRLDYDRDLNDTSPFQAGWRAGGMHGGGMSRGLDRDRSWNLGGGDRDWGHNWGAGGINRYDRGYTAGGTSRGGGFLDRAANAVRRGWDDLEDRFDRDDDRMHPGGGAMRGGTRWSSDYDRDWRHPGEVRGYRGAEGHHGLTHTGGMMGGNVGMNRYGSDFDRGRLDRDRLDFDRGYDRGFKSREQTDAGDPFGDRPSHTPIRMTGSRGGLGRYDDTYRGSRNWF